MKARSANPALPLLAGLAAACVAITAIGVAGCAAQKAPVAAAGGWFFAVAGDSRDCGDLIMPKIAQSIRRHQESAPVDFYWHLGDFRRMFDVDCDYAKRRNARFDCANRPAGALGDPAMDDYLTNAWSDFIRRQIHPFGALPVFLGIGNHELLAGRTRDEFRRKFQRWLTQEPIHTQRSADFGHHIPSTEGDTYYHFVVKGVDFIYLDNAEPNAVFSPEQLDWLDRVIRQDAHDPAIKTVVAGMHAALPDSSASGHAMDSTCCGLCGGRQAYELLFGLTTLAKNPKHVYVLASHAHQYLENIYLNRPQGRVLPGWIVGTAGAEQYVKPIRYGYLEMEVQADGALRERFREVTRDMPPAASGPGAGPLADYCFAGNQRETKDNVFRSPCTCASAVSDQTHCLLGKPPAPPPAAAAAPPAAGGP